MMGVFEAADSALIFLLVVNAGWVVVLSVVAYMALKRDDRETEENGDGLWRMEIGWVVVVAVVWVSLNAYTVSAMASGDPVPEENVTVDAAMWGYSLSDRTVPVNESVEFRAESHDTVHSFTVYDPNGDIVLNMMLVPGTEQRKVYTFEETGEYEVRCLEYCGKGHAKMTDGFEVVEGE